jgi:general secretion pathway protein D
MRWWMMTFALLILVLSGCATQRGPDYKVGINAKGVAQILDTDQAESGHDNSPASNLEPVIKTGANRLFNAPRKREYSTGTGEHSLDFINIPVEEFVSIVFKEMLGTNYVLDSAIKGEVTVQTRGKVDSDQILSIVESVLASKNAVMIDHGNYFELIPFSKAKNYSLKPELFSARHIKPGYRMVVIPVNYIKADDLKAIINSVAPSVGHLKIDGERRAVVVTGSEQEIRNIHDAIQIFDVNWLHAKSIALLPIKHTSAATIKSELGKLLKSQNKSNEVVLETFERFNALLAVADHASEIRAIREWIEVFDVEVPTADAGLFVYEVQNRKAVELADMLNSIFGDSEATLPGSNINADNDTVSADEIIVTNKSKASPRKTISTAEDQSAPLKIVADEINNAVVILAEESRFKSIKEVIKTLDTIPLQVLIEVSIVEVTLTDELSFGVEWFLRHKGISDKYDADTTLDLNGGSGLGAIVPGFSFLLGGSGSLVQAVFNTLASESKLNVISSPSLMALDNHTATIRVGDQQPVQVSSAKSTNNDVLTQSIEYKSTGVLLSVTPRVNSGGLVTMELSQEVTDVGSIDDATGQRSFLQRNINSTVAVQDGSTIILGGLITENSVNSESGLPGVHKLPFIGRLFGKTTDSKVKRELIVLITPKVIFNHEGAIDITREYASKMELLKSSLDIQQ